MDFAQQPPAQELIAKDLHGNEWKFRHIFRGIYMGTITGISDIDPVHWPNSHWRSVKSLNFQGISVTPWMRPRLDNPLLPLQPDMYQTMAVAGQKMRIVDTAKNVSPGMLQFQQTQNITSRTSPIVPSQVLQHGHSQTPQTFRQNIQVNQVQDQSQSEFLQHQLQHRCSFGEQQQLRSELGRLFGLEGQLEDPLRSGWQLVFVDRENDILLVGDDPWQEFVNNVWCIKILMRQEVQQMGKPSADFLNTVHGKRLPSNSCDEYITRQDSRSLSSTVTTSVGTLEY
ncbi:hypothetical protein BHE74_00026478 [Ensete ventricosum]|nr:hypothetical protein BHE74_00026478 [Ensete ventricosum]